MKPAPGRIIPFLLSSRIPATARSPCRTRLAAAAAAAATSYTSVSTATPPHSSASASIHTSAPARPARVHMVTGAGPPPDPPEPSPESVDARIARRKKQAEALKGSVKVDETGGYGSGEVKGAAAEKLKGDSKALKKRFWKDVSVREVEGAFEIHLDTRALRHPTTKTKVRLPLSKPHLAAALALEWDLLESAQQATRQHLIPLTSLICRALDIAEDDAAAANAVKNSTSATTTTSDAASTALGPIRRAIATTLLRYLDTDSLLCWAPAPVEPPVAGDRPPLRDMQEAAARPVIAHLTTHVWPGLPLEPVLEDANILLPRAQAPGVREAVRAWIVGLDAWDLAGLERAALAGKGVLGAARLVAEWSEGSAKVKSGLGQPAEKKFGVEEAARAASVEVDYQTQQWGEVEDTHDVEKEDVRRQLGSVVLLVSGKGTSS